MYKTKADDIQHALNYLGLQFQSEKAEATFKIEQAQFIERLSVYLKMHKNSLTVKPEKLTKYDTGLTCQCIYYRNSAQQLGFETCKHTIAKAALSPILYLEDRVAKIEFIGLLADIKHFQGREIND